MAAWISPSRGAAAEAASASSSAASSRLRVARDRARPNRARDDPDSRRAELITDGIARAAMDGVSDVRVRVGSTAWRFDAGHRIRIDIAGSNFPRFDRNPASGTHSVHPGSKVLLPIKEV